MTEQKFLDLVETNIEDLKNIPNEFKSNREWVLKAMPLVGSRYLSIFLSFLDDNIKDDKEIVIKFIKDCPVSLKFASDRLKDDKEVVMTATERQGSVLKYASDRLKDDKKVVLSAVKDEFQGFQYASERLQKDFKIAQLAISHDPLLLGMFPSKFRNNKEIVLIAVSQYGRMLEYASEDLKTDKEVALTAFKHDWRSILFFSNELQHELADKGIIEQSDWMPQLQKRDIQFPQVIKYLHSHVLNQELNNELAIENNKTKTPKI